MSTGRFYIAAAAAALLLAGCNNDEYKYDPARASEMIKEQYSANFKKSFGDIASNQSWDFAGEPFTSIASSRAVNGSIQYPYDTAYPYLDTDKYYDIPANVQTALNGIKEKKDNGSLACAYALSVPDNSFAVIPIRQGQVGSSFEVHMVIGTGENAVDYKLWSWGEAMQRRKAGTNNKWENVTAKYESTTYGNFDVRSRVYHFKDMKPDEPMYFYLYRENNTQYPSSLEGYMKDFTSIIPAPEEFVRDDKKVKIIGVEGQRDAAWNDNDYEDVMFMIVGDPTLPEDITKTDDMKFQQTITKRYMIEDLGDTDDFDFNDIVVDVKSSRSISFNYDEKSGNITGRTYGEWREQTATIKHLGGTLPFNLTIGSKTLGWKDGQMNKDLNDNYDIEGWNPETNNISIEIRQTKDAEGVNSIGFPTAGSVPMIIATSTEQAWMPERQSIIDKLHELILNQDTKD